MFLEMMKSMMSVSDIEAGSRASFRLPFAGKLLRLRDLLGRHLRGDLIPISFRVSVPSGRGQVEPHVRGDIVLRDAKAKNVHEPETGLSVSAALIGRLAIPTRRSRMVLRDAQAVGVLEPELVLSEGVALLGRLAKPTRRTRIVRRDDYPKQVPKRGLGGAITLLRKRTHDSHRSVIVAAPRSGRSIPKQEPKCYQRREFRLKPAV